MNPLRTKTPLCIAVPLCAAIASVLLGASALGHGTSHELIDAATRAIAEKPGDAAQYLRRAKLHLEHGDLNACLSDVAEAERRQGQEIGAALVRGRAFAAGGRFAEAREVLDRIIETHPDHAGALMERARVLRSLGKKEDAAEEFARAMSLVPQPEPDQVFEVAAFLCAAGREVEALAAVDRALKLTPGVPSLVECGVKIEMDRKNFDAALRRIKEAIRAVKTKEPLMARRAAVLAQAGRIAESLAAWKELRLRLAALPSAERESHAMASLSERTRHAIGALTSLHP